MLTALVLHFRSWQETLRCVEALQAQDVADLEILIIDNHSDDDSLAVLRARLRGMSNVRILESAKNGGFGKGYAIGIRQSRGTYTLINNPSKHLKPGALQVLIEEMDANPDIGIIAPKVMHADGTRRLSARRFPRPLDVFIKRTFLSGIFKKRVDHYLMLDTDPAIACDPDWVVGGCFLIRTDLLKKLDGFDPRFRFFFEDIDLCRRCRMEGYRVRYEPRAVAMDRKRRLSEMHPLSMMLHPLGRMHIQSALRYFLKWRGQSLPGNV